MFGRSRIVCQLSLRTHPENCKCKSGRFFIAKFLTVAVEMLFNHLNWESQLNVDVKQPSSLRFANICGCARERKKFQELKAHDKEDWQIENEGDTALWHAQSQLAGCSTVMNSTNWTGYLWFESPGLAW